jgi:hypothetical protein
MTDLRFAMSRLRLVVVAAGFAMCQLPKFDVTPVSFKSDTYE